MTSTWLLFSCFLTVVSTFGISAQQFGTCEMPANAISFNLDQIKGVWYCQAQYNYGNEDIKSGCLRSEIFVTSANIAYNVGSSFDEGNLTWRMGFSKFEKSGPYEIQASYAISPDDSGKIYTLLLNETDWVMSSCQFKNGSLVGQQTIITATKVKLSSIAHARALLKKLEQPYTQEHDFNNCEACYDTRRLPCRSRSVSGSQ